MSTRALAGLGAALMLLLVGLVACDTGAACAAGPAPAPRPPAPAPRVVAPAAPRPAPAPRVQQPARPAPARTVYKENHTTTHTTSVVPVWVPWFGGDDDCD